MQHRPTRSPLPRLAGFVRAEDGAVTVDYVVLTAAAMAVAIGAASSVKSSLSRFAGSVNGDLSGQSDEGAFANSTSYANGFENGSGGDWGQGVAVTNVTGLGNVLGPFAQSDGSKIVSRDFALADGIPYAEMQFDLFTMDSVNHNEYGAIFIDDREIGRVDADGVFTAIGDLEALGIEVDATVIKTGTQLGGDMDDDEWSGNDDQTRFNIRVTDPEATINFGFGAKLNDGANNEFYAIDDFRIVGLAVPD
jgi:Flp pilus assembly pilin Flp